MKKFIYICFLSIFLFSCSDDDTDFKKFHFERLTIDEITFPDSFNYNELDTVWFTYTLPTKCHYSYELEYIPVDSTRYISIISYVDDEQDTCVDVTTQKESFIPIKISQTEDYLFKIWKGVNDDNENIYEEYTVPVIDPDDQP